MLADSLEQARKLNAQRPQLKVPTFVVDDKNQGGKIVAKIIADAIQNHKQQRPFVLGLATGASPVPIYESLVELNKNGQLSFSNVVTFNLDEYYPMKADDPHSYRYFMNQHLFSHIDIDMSKTHVPSGEVSEEDIEKSCKEYEDMISENGIDLQLLGIGRDGHLGFNEPGSGTETFTRLSHLHAQTITDAAADFGGEENVPKTAITMGIGSILKARKCVLVAWGAKKSQIVYKALTSDISSEVPATFLQNHADSVFVVDKDVADAFP